MDFLDFCCNKTNIIDLYNTTYSYNNFITIKQVQKLCMYQITGLVSKSTDFTQTIIISLKFDS